MSAAAPYRPANFDSLEPILTCDPNHLPTEKVTFSGASHAKVELVTTDARLEARMVGSSMLTLLGWVPDEGPFDAYLALKVDGNFVSLALHQGMSSEDIIHEVRRGLPVGYEVVTREGSLSDVLMLNILRPEAGAPAPQLHFLATDPEQQFFALGRNQLRIEGRAARGLQMRSHLELFIEGYRLRLPLAGGDFPISTAKRLREALPKKYTALIGLPLIAGGDVTLTILSRR